MSSPSVKKTHPFIALLDRAGMQLILGALIIVCWFSVRNFGSPENIMNLLLQVSTVGIVATTMLVLSRVG